MTIKVPSEDIFVENAKITYRNFAGNEGEYNVKGARNFAVEIATLEEAEALEEAGWKVKYSKVREDGGEARFPAYMPVHVKYHPNLAPPRIKMITSRGQNTLLEDDIDVLDFMDIAKSDMRLRPFHWKQKSGAEGVKNMLVSIYVTIREDELELKYADIPEAVEPTLRPREIDAGDDVWEDLGEVNEQKALEKGF